MQSPSNASRQSKVYFFRTDRVTPSPLKVLPGQVLGRAVFEQSYLDDAKTSSTSYSGKTVFQALHEISAATFGYHSCFLVEDDHLAELLDQALSFASLHKKSGTIAVFPVDLDQAEPAEINWPTISLVVSHVYIDVIRRFVFSGEGIWRFRLPNGQNISFNIGDPAQAYGDWIMIYPLFEATKKNLLGSKDRQLFPFNRSGEPTANPFIALLNPDDPILNRKNYLRVSLFNASLSEPFRSVELKMVASKGVPLGRLMLHETLVLAMGAYPGDIAVVEDSGRTLSFADRIGAFKSRILAARAVIPPNVDVGYAVCRVSGSAMGVLGLSDNESVIVTGKTPNADSNSKGRLKLRILKAQDDDSQQDDEHESLPHVSLDLVQRESLNVKTNDVVFLRPAVAGMLADELVLAGNALVIAAAGGLVADRIWLAIGASLLFLALVIVSFWRRFR